MIEAIKSFFENKLAKKNQEEAPSSAMSRIDLTCAALLVEVMNSDNELDEREHQEFMAVVQKSYNIAESDLEELSQLAKDEADEATSLYQFTKLINDSYDYEQKVGLIENMWRIAFSDKRLDKYEDNLIRKVADLIYVSHSDFIKTKLKVRVTE
ncbi:MAG: TerB family tellurite resistance protein [Gammaproteobacteria bacterium]|nr:TerB family tellurite resistance protein [Gammaproteobacteria bacterium]MBL4729163.1 TerB family tellurite resistance protein [Gammaproteobacteria bacterium]